MSRRQRSKRKKAAIRSFAMRPRPVLALVVEEVHQSITFRPGDYTPVEHQPSSLPVRLFRAPNGETWMGRGKCVTEDHRLAAFFEDVWPEDADGDQLDLNEEALAFARSVCDRCPVRRKCYAEACAEEGNAAIDQRAGVRAGTTPAQRWSARHRRAIHCPVCHAALDPNAVRMGEIACVNECAIDRTMPPIPEYGDQWTRRHTTLARKVVKWLIESVEVGETIPRPTDLATRWSERRTDTCRVFEALVADGTLEFDGRDYRRHTRIAAAHETYLPFHLILTAQLVPEADAVRSAA